MYKKINDIKYHFDGEARKVLRERGISYNTFGKTILPLLFHNHIPLDFTGISGADATLFYKYDGMGKNLPSFGRVAGFEQNTIKFLSDDTFEIRYMMNFNINDRT